MRNDGANDVTEFEVLDGARILGEAENIAPGLSGSFSLTLKPGTYTTYCPGGTTSEKGTLLVTGAGAAKAGAAAKAAVADYRAYLEAQTAALVGATGRFVAAVKAGDVARAKTLYGPARVPYERIEPVAESFGGLDPAIDARAGDVPKAQWTGFHPLEQALWVKGSVAGQDALADGLLRDVKKLRTLTRTVELEPAQIANGAVELLGEVSKSKVTGEEERYSHIDLVDFEANVDGANAAFQAVRPIVAKQDSELAKTIDQRFAASRRRSPSTGRATGSSPIAFSPRRHARALARRSTRSPSRSRRSARSSSHSSELAALAQATARLRGSRRRSRSPSEEGSRPVAAATTTPRRPRSCRSSARVRRGSRRRRRTGCTSPPSTPSPTRPPTCAS